MLNIKLSFFAYYFLAVLPTETLDSVKNHHEMIGHVVYIDHENQIIIAAVMAEKNTNFAFLKRMILLYTLFGIT